MTNSNQQNSDNSRKNESRETMKQTDNNRNYPGDSADRKVASEQNTEKIRQDTESTERERNRRESEDESLRGVNQRPDLKGEAQNVNDDAGRPLTRDEASRASDKAMEGQRQNRDEGKRSTNAERTNDKRS